MWIGIDFDDKEQKWEYIEEGQSGYYPQLWVAGVTPSRLRHEKAKFQMGRTREYSYPGWVGNEYLSKEEGVCLAMQGSIWFARKCTDKLKFVCESEGWYYTSLS